MATIQRVLRTMAFVLATVLVFVTASVSASAHEKHKHLEKRQAQKVLPAPADASLGRAAMEPGTVTDAHGNMGEMMGEDEPDRSQMSFGGRLINWVGRLHPTIVHFPIAFFPAALFTAIVGRRRPAFEAPVRFLVVAGGIIAPIAAVLGWLDAINAEPSSLLDAHRWLGTMIGAAGLAMAVWAFLRPERCRSAGMMIALAAITAAIVVQGWYGGAMVHGIDHLNW